MTGYAHVWDFERDTARLIAGGATLRDLYDAMLTIEDVRGRTVDASPKTLHAMAETWWQTPSFAWIRLTELFGGLVVPHTDDYVLAMVGHLGGRNEQEIRLHILRHDHELRDDIFWRIFEVEGGGEISLTNIDAYSRESLSWQNIVIQLSAEGALDRVRLLRSCLEALSRDFSSYRAGWFSRVYSALSPSAFEAAADQDLLRQCLGSSVSANVSLATKHLMAIQKSGLLETLEFVDACGPALAGPKVAASAILRMLDSIAAEHAESRDAIASTAAYALAHPHVDVQRAAVMLLVTLGREDIARESRGALAPTVAAELLPDAAPHSHGAFSTAEVVDVNVPQPVQPWSDDDARERFSALLEFGTSAIELELALAWLAITEHAAPTLAPLVKRARKVDMFDGRFWLAELIQSAVDRNWPFLPQPTWQRSNTVVVDGKPTQVAFGEVLLLQTAEEITVFPSLVTRMREVASIIAGSAQRRVLLATPTDTHGWIDPDVLLSRFEQVHSPFPVDLTQAILRTPPAERDRMMTALKVSPPEVTKSISIEWRPRKLRRTKPDGAPMSASFDPYIVASAADAPSTTQPSFIPSTSHEQPEERMYLVHGVIHMRHERCTTGLVASSLGLVNPASTLPLVAAGVLVMHSATSEVNHAAGPVLDALASNPGQWTPETVQLVALGMAALHAELRTRSVELFAASIPSRISASEAAIGFAACEPAIPLNRWTSSLTDAATIAPLAVIDMLTHLLPKLSRATRGIGGLLGLLVDESIRHQLAITDPDLRNWLEGFSGSSAAAKAAKAALSISPAEP